MQKTVLVTGGAGYIGSHACWALAQAGYRPVTYDNLSTGWRDAVQFGPFEEGDTRDRDRLDAVLAKHRPIGVMHFASLSNISEANQVPSLYWDNNTVGTFHLVDAVIQAGIEALVFSSTCAVYAERDGEPLTETTPQKSLTAYDGSKRAAEDMIRDMTAGPGVALRYMVFRYFNVAGAVPQAGLGEFHRPETHLIPLALAAAAGERGPLTINGTDYPTPDGTCIRDYIHVADLVDAHVRGLEYLLAGGQSDICNLGSGRGFSVREIMGAVSKVTGQHVPHDVGGRRVGDKAALVSNSAKARRLLNWEPQRSDLDTMISSAWDWHQMPGYRA